MFLLPFPEHYNTIVIIHVNTFLFPVLRQCPRQATGRTMALAEMQRTKREKRAMVSGTSLRDGHRLSMYKMQSTVAGGSFTLHCF